MDAVQCIHNLLTVIIFSLFGFLCVLINRYCGIFEIESQRRNERRTYNENTLYEAEVTPSNNFIVKTPGECQQTMPLFDFLEDKNKNSCACGSSVGRSPSCERCCSRENLTCETCAATDRICIFQKCEQKKDSSLETIEQHTIQVKLRYNQESFKSCTMDKSFNCALPFIEKKETIICRQECAPKCIPSCSKSCSTKCNCDKPSCSCSFKPSYTPIPTQCPSRSRDSSLLSKISSKLLPKCPANKCKSSRESIPKCLFASFRKNSSNSICKCSALAKCKQDNYCKSIETQVSSLLNTCKKCCGTSPRFPCSTIRKNTSNMICKCSAAAKCKQSVICKSVETQACPSTSTCKNQRESTPKCIFSTIRKNSSTTRCKCRSVETQVCPTPNKCKRIFERCPLMMNKNATHPLCRCSHNAKCKNFTYCKSIEKQTCPTPNTCRKTIERCPAIKNKNATHPLCKCSPLTSSKRTHICKSVETQACLSQNVCKKSCGTNPICPATVNKKSSTILCKCSSLANCKRTNTCRSVETQACPALNTGNNSRGTTPMCPAIEKSLSNVTCKCSPLAKCKRTYLCKSVETEACPASSVSKSSRGTQRCPSATKISSSNVTCKCSSQADCKRTYLCKSVETQACPASNTSKSPRGTIQRCPSATKKISSHIICKCSALAKCKRACTCKSVETQVCSTSNINKKSRGTTVRCSSAIKKDSSNIICKCSALAKCKRAGTCKSVETQACPASNASKTSRGSSPKYLSSIIRKTSSSLLCKCSTTAKCKRPNKLKSVETQICSPAAKCRSIATPCPVFSPCPSKTGLTLLCRRSNSSTCPSTSRFSSGLSRKSSTILCKCSSSAKCKNASTSSPKFSLMNTCALNKTSLCKCCSTTKCRNASTSSPKFSSTKICTLNKDKLCRCSSKAKCQKSTSITPKSSTSNLCKCDGKTSMRKETSVIYKCPSATTPNTNNTRCPTFTPPIKCSTPVQCKLEPKRVAKTVSLCKRCSAKLDTSERKRSPPSTPSYRSRNPNTTKRYLGSPLKNTTPSSSNCSLKSSSMVSFNESDISIKCSCSSLSTDPFRILSKCSNTDLCKSSSTIFRRCPAALSKSVIANKSKCTCKNPRYPNTFAPKWCFKEPNRNYAESPKITNITKLFKPKTKCSRLETSNCQATSRINRIKKSSKCSFGRRCPTSFLPFPARRSKSICNFLKRFTNKVQFSDCQPPRPATVNTCNRCRAGSPVTLKKDVKYRPTTPTNKAPFFVNNTPIVMPVMCTCSSPKFYIDDLNFQGKESSRTVPINNSSKTPKQQLANKTSTQSSSRTMKPRTPSPFRKPPCQNNPSMRCGCSSNVPCKNLSRSSPPSRENSPRSYSLRNNNSPRATSPQSSSPRSNSPRDNSPRNNFSRNSFTWDNPLRNRFVPCENIPCPNYPSSKRYSQMKFPPRGYIPNITIQSRKICPPIDYDSSSSDSSIDISPNVSRCTCNNCICKKCTCKRPNKVSSSTVTVKVKKDKKGKICVKNSIPSNSKTALLFEYDIKESARKKSVENHYSDSSESSEAVELSRKQNKRRRSSSKDKTCQCVEFADKETQSVYPTDATESEPSSLTAVRKDISWYTRCLCDLFDLQKRILLHNKMNLNRIPGNDISVGQITQRSMSMDSLSNRISEPDIEISTSQCNCNINIVKNPSTNKNELCISGSEYNLKLVSYGKMSIVKQNERRICCTCDSNTNLRCKRNSFQVSRQCSTSDFEAKMCSQNRQRERASSSRRHSSKSNLWECHCLDHKHNDLQELLESKTKDMSTDAPQLKPCPDPKRCENLLAMSSKQVLNDDSKGTVEIDCKPSCSKSRPKSRKSTNNMLPNFAMPNTFLMDKNPPPSTSCCQSSNRSYCPPHNQCYPQSNNCNYNNKCCWGSYGRNNYTCMRLESIVAAPFNLKEIIAPDDTSQLQRNDGKVEPPPNADDPKNLNTSQEPGLSVADQDKKQILKNEFFTIPPENKIFATVQPVVGKLTDIENESCSFLKKGTVNNLQKDNGSEKSPKDIIKDKNTNDIKDDTFILNPKAEKSTSTITYNYNQQQTQTSLVLDLPNSSSKMVHQIEASLIEKTISFFTVGKGINLLHNYKKIADLLKEKKCKKISLSPISPIRKRRFNYKDFKVRCSKKNRVNQIKNSKNDKENNREHNRENNRKEDAEVKRNNIAEKRNVITGSTPSMKSAISHLPSSSFDHTTEYPNIYRNAKKYSYSTKKDEQQSAQDIDRAYFICIEKRKKQNESSSSSSKVDAVSMIVQTSDINVSHKIDKCTGIKKSVLTEAQNSLIKNFKTAIEKIPNAFEFQCDTSSDSMEAEKRYFHNKTKGKTQVFNDKPKKHIIVKKKHNEIVMHKQETEEPRERKPNKLTTTNTTKISKNNPVIINKTHLKLNTYGTAPLQQKTVHKTEPFMQAVENPRKKAQLIRKSQKPTPQPPHSRYGYDMNMQKISDMNKQPVYAVSKYETMIPIDPMTQVYHYINPENMLSSASYVLSEASSSSMSSSNSNETIMDVDHFSLKQSLIMIKEKYSPYLSSTKTSDTNKFYPYRSMEVVEEPYTSSKLLNSTPGPSKQTVIKYPNSSSRSPSKKIPQLRIAHYDESANIFLQSDSDVNLDFNTQDYLYKYLPSRKFPDDDDSFAL